MRDIGHESLFYAHEGPKHEPGNEKNRNLSTVTVSADLNLPTELLEAPTMNAAPDKATVF